MERKKIAIDWVEPAHPGVLKFRDYLLEIYRLIRQEKLGDGTFQSAIDKAFDAVSGKIGFVVATNLVVGFDVGSKGEIGKVAFAAEHFKGTLFEDAFKPILENLQGLISAAKSKVEAGRYTLHLFWFEALKLRFRADWLEPAHFRWIDAAERYGMDPGQFVMGGYAAAAVDPNVVEPAHLKPSPVPWWDKVLTVVIDEVYPELRLLERIAQAREYRRQAVRFEVMEPAHYMRLEERLPREVLEELEGILRKYGY